MAGYFIYSVDWELFHKFVTAPTDDQIRKFAETIDDGYENVMDEFEDEDSSLAKSWSSDGDDPEAAIRAHLKKDDWYAGLGHNTCSIWSLAIEEMTQDLGFRCDSDGIYWNLIDLATKTLGKQSDKTAVARFGRCPYSVKAIEPYEPKEWGYAWWDPYHSMHPPDEVKQLFAEMESLSSTVESANDDQATEDFEELMPVLEKIVQENRMLYIAVDT